MHSLNPNPTTVAQLSQVLTKYFQSERSQGCSQSRLCHFNCVVTGIANRHVYKGEGSI